MRDADDLPAVEGWHNRFGEKWHVLKTCAGNGEWAMSLREAVDEPTVVSVGVQEGEE